MASVAVERRSNGEGADDLLEWHRRFCKAQRQRLAYKFTAAEKRVTEARTAAMEAWDGQSRLFPGGKKPGLDYYDARWR